MERNPHQLVGLTGPANNFAMGGLPMHFARILITEGKPVPHMLFHEIMVEKSQILIEHVNNHHVGLCLTANIGQNSAIICVYDNFATVNTQMLQSDHLQPAKMGDTTIHVVHQSNGHPT